MPPGATGLIIEHDDRRIPFQIIAAVGPEVGALGLALAGGELLHRGFISVEHAP